MLQAGAGVHKLIEDPEDAQTEPKSDVATNGSSHQVCSFPSHMLLPPRVASLIPI